MVITVSTYKNTSFFDWMSPKDVYAGIILLGGMILIANGINHIVSGLMIAITSYYFRKRQEDK